MSDLAFAFVLAVVGAVAQIVLGFCGFWLVWRFLLPYLPGPENSRDRVAPVVRHFTDPSAIRSRSGYSCLRG